MFHGGLDQEIERWFPWLVRVSRPFGWLGFDSVRPGYTRTIVRMSWDWDGALTWAVWG